MSAPKNAINSGIRIHIHTPEELIQALKAAQSRIINQQLAAATQRESARLGGEYQGIQEAIGLVNEYMQTLRATVEE